MNYQTTRELLAQYPSSFAKSEASRLIRNAMAGADLERPLKYRVYDILYAFQMLEARRLGIRRDRNPVIYAKFKLDYIEMIAMWVPGKDPLIDGIREAITELEAGDSDKVMSFLKDAVEFEKRRTSIEQKRRASRPRRPGPFRQYLQEKLKINPSLTDPELRQEIERDYLCGNSIFSDVTPDLIEVDVLATGECETLTRSAVRNRLFRLKNFNKSR